MKIEQRVCLVLICVALAGFWVSPRAQQPPPVSPPPTPVVITPTGPGGASGGTPVTRPSGVEEDQPAVPTVEVPSAAEPDHSREQVLWGLIMAYVLQWLKRTKIFPWLTEETTSRTKAVWGFVMAVMTAIGINVAVQGSVWDASGAAITFSGISIDAFKDIVWQWAAQQGWYDLIVRNNSAARAMGARHV